MAQAKQSYIYRAPKDKENPYAMIRRDTLRDRSLTWEARGVLAYLLSQSDSWKVVIGDLEQNCGRDVVYNILNELKEHGYIERVSERDSKGHVLSWNYAVHEQSLLTEMTEVGLEQKTLLTENPTLGKPYFRDSSTLKNNELNALKKKEKNAPLALASLPPEKSKPKPKPKTPAPAIKPTVKPSEQKAKPTPKPRKSSGLPYWLSKLPAVKPVVLELLAVCYSGFDPIMMTAENSLTVPQLEKYITGAEEFIRLGGVAADVKPVYEFVSEQVDHIIAPQTVAGYLLRWKASQQADQPPPVVSKQVSKVSPTGTKPMSDADRQKLAAQIRKDRATLFGDKRATSEHKAIG